MRILFGAACLALVSACAREPRATPRPDVLLITIDTLRADHLSCAGYALPTTPQLDGLARAGVRFARAQSPRAKTTPAIASLMTGAYPQVHGVRDLAVPLARDVPVLAEALARAGYACGAVVGNWVLTRAVSGLDRGFEVWIEDLPQTMGVPPDDVPQRCADSLAQAALELLDLNGAETASAARLDARRPRFAWLHFMDPHGTYDPPPAARLFHSASEPMPPPAAPAPSGPSHPGRWVAEYNVPDGARLPDGRIDVARVRDLYDGEIRAVDDAIGRVLEALRGAGRLERTLVIVSADHGESFGENDYWFEHGRYASEATCRVPLIVRFPEGAAGARGRARFAPGSTSDMDVSLADLAPTVLDALGLPPLAEVRPNASRVPSPRGASLLDAAQGAQRAVFCEKVERLGDAGVVQTKAVRRGPWKLVLRLAVRERPRAAPERPGAAPERALVALSEALYDVDRDPAETRDLLGAAPAECPLEDLRAALARFVDSDVELLDTRARAAAVPGDEDVARKLRALGY